MTFEMEFRRHADGVELVGEAPPRIRMTQEVLDDPDPAVVTVNADCDVMFSLANAMLWYRRVELGDGWVEFERVT